MLKCLNIKMILIAGLGNPGKRFQESRHNIGFRIVDNFQSKVGNFSGWKNDKKLFAEISEGNVINQKIILAKPQTFMNESGKAIKSLIGNLKFPEAPRSFYKKGGAYGAGKIENLIIVHDDIDLPLGKIRIVKNRGAGGHKGVKSIIRELKTKDFVRFRVGIKPQKIENRKQKIEDFVLQKFNREEEKIVKEVIRKTVEAIEFAIKEGLEKAMSEFNK